jgi:hypothetical protein
MYLQYQRWAGLLFRHSGTLGFEFRLYPVKPLSLRAKAGFQLFEVSFIEEAELEVGCMLKAWEIFAGYRWWTLPEDATSTPASWEGPYLGIRRYF